MELIDVTPAAKKDTAVAARIPKSYKDFIDKHKISIAKSIMYVVDELKNNGVK